MNKRLLLLFGFAITAVILNHAIYWVLDSHHVWVVPGWLARNEAGGLALHNFLYALLAILKKLATFCVPSFLFASGFFSAFSGRKTGSGSQLRITSNRVLALVIPYLVWAIVIFVANPYGAVQRDPGKFLARLVYGGVIPEYYFIPLLIQFTILAPLITDWARNKSARLLTVAVLLQLGVAAVSYLNVFVPVPVIGHLLDINRTWSLFPTWALFFPLGMVVGFHQTQFTQFITRYRAWLIAGMILFATLAMLENEFVLLPRGTNWRDSPLTIPTTLYALCAIGVFMGTDFKNFFLSKPLLYLSNKTFAIYLIHSLAIRLLYNYITDYQHVWKSYPIFYLFILMAAAFIMPLALIEIVRRTPLRSLNRFLFG